MKTKIVIDHKEDVIRLVNIPARQLSKQTINALQEHGEIYRDQVLKEHLYSVETTREQVDSKELKMLSKIADKYEAAYIRLIY